MPELSPPTLSHDAAGAARVRLGGDWVAAALAERGQARRLLRQLRASAGVADWDLSAVATEVFCTPAFLSVPITSTSNCTGRSR